MIDKKTIAMFEEQQIRRIWYEDERYFVLEDIILALVNSNDPKQYIKKMRQRDPELQKGWVQFVPTLKVPTSGGLQKMNCVNTQSALRLIQSIPSPKAEPFKLWLASLGNQRVEESNDPELGMQRARERAIQVYRGRGMSDKEIEQRLQTIDTRHHYTDELKARGIKDGLEYALLTNISYHRSGKTAKEYKEHKGLVNTDNLRDHMTRTEMLLTGLSEEAGVEIAKSKDAKGFEEVQDIIPNRPSPARTVNDLTGDFLSADEIATLEKKLRAFNDSTSTQIVIAIVPDLGEYDRARFATELGQKWGVGQKGKDNGIVVLIKPKTTFSDGQAFIAPGYGLESVLPDITCTNIAEEEMIRRFKEEDNHRFEGLDEGINVIMSLAKKEYSADYYNQKVAEDQKTRTALIIIVICLAVAGLLGFFHWSVSGFGGCISTPIVWFCFFPFTPLALFLAILIGFAGGMLAHGVILLKTGGGSGGGFGSSGGGDSGGFSFGGGSFGGGGGGGSW